MKRRRTLDASQLEAVLARAVELDGDPGEGGFTEDDLDRVGREIGLSAGAVDAALDEWRRGRVVTARALPPTGLLGPDRLVIERASGRDIARLETLTTRYLTDRGMLRSRNGSAWVQHDGWWPDLQRLAAPTRLAVSFQPTGWGVLLRVVADVGRLRLSHLRMALAAVILPLLMLVSGAGAATAGWSVPVAIAVAGWSAAGYRRRLRGIEERLLYFVDEVAGRDGPAGTP